MLQYFGPILTYGTLGLAAILAYLTYRLIQQESQRDPPRDSILLAANRFMNGTILLAVVCGLLATLDTFVKNSTDVSSSDKDRINTLKSEAEKSEKDLTELQQKYTEVEKKRTDTERDLSTTRKRIGDLMHLKEGKVTRLGMLSPTSMAFALLVAEIQLDLASIDKMIREVTKEVE